MCSPFGPQIHGGCGKKTCAQMKVGSEKTFPAPDNSSKAHFVACRNSASAHLSTK